MFEPFMIRLVELATNSKPVATTEKADVFESVLTNWKNEEALLSTLVEICDYHCEHMDDDGGDWEPEFAHAPFDLIPWELLATQQIRDNLGLSLPDIDHPICSPRVMRVPLPVQIQDEFLPLITAAFGPYL